MAGSGLSDAKFDVISEYQSDKNHMIMVLPALQDSPSGNEKHYKINKPA